MKKTALFLVALIALGSFSAGEAKAATFRAFSSTGPSVDMGLIENGQYGTINTATSYGANDWVASGILQSHSYILFSYTLTDTSPTNLFESSANSGVIGAVIPSFIPASYYNIKQSEFINDLGNKVFTVKISNLVSAALNFSSYIYLPTYAGNVATTYTTVPLPAALPLLGLGLVGLAGIKRMRKNKTTA